MRLYDFKLVSPLVGTVPDAYACDNGARPGAEFVVALNSKGEVASRYGDDAWDCTAYHPDNKPTFFHFYCWNNKNIKRHILINPNERQRQLMDEAKWLLFILMFLKEGTSLAIRTVRQHMVAIRTMQTYCYERNIALPVFLADDDLLRDCFAHHPRRAGSAGVILRALYDLGPEVVGYEVARRDTIQEFLETYTELTKNNKQNAPIPTRIYSNIISALSRELDEYESISKNLLCLVREYLADGGVCNLGDRIPALGLDEYFLKRNQEHTAHKLSAAVSEFLMVCALQVQCFTGMRVGEVMTLPYDCLSYEIREGRKHWIVTGHTTKLNNGLKKVGRWVTSDSGRRAIELAQGLALVMYEALGISETELNGLSSGRYLFINSILGGVTANGERPAQLDLSRFPQLVSRLILAIEESDIQELEQVDPHRAWRTEPEYQIGNPWPFRTHQLRRSLALYAQRSGLVSLPSLKRQLKHITDEMTSYYAKGSEFANNFIGDNKHHFGNEWRETQPESQFLGYLANVLLADDSLFGGHSNWVERRVKGADGSVLVNRDDTLKKFRNGQLAFKETALGGCVNTGACDSGLVDLLDIGCLSKGCKNQVISLKKLDKVITIQTKRVERLSNQDPSCVELRDEERTLEVLLNSRKGAAATLEPV